MSEKNVDEPEELFVVPVTRDKLFISSEEGYNSIEIYKQENKLVINAQSEAAFFDGVQFTVEIEGEIAQEDVEIIWMTIGGNTESPLYFSFSNILIKVVDCHFVPLSQFFTPSRSKILLM